MGEKVGEGDKRQAGQSTSSPGFRMEVIFEFDTAPAGAGRRRMRGAGRSRAALCR